MAQMPVKVYGLKVPPGDFVVPVEEEIDVPIRITMAAIDPTETPIGDVSGAMRSTLKIIKLLSDSDDEDDEDMEDDEYLQAMLGGGSDESDSDDEEVNGGPSDPSKSKKARQAAAIKKLLEMSNGDESDEEMEDAANGTKSVNKGKGKATDEDDEDSDDEEEDDDEAEEFVVCTLDTERNYQQPLDIVIRDGEKIFFKCTGNHAIHLTGNYVIDTNRDEHSDDDDYDLPPGMEDLDEDELSDELDDTPRIRELSSDEEEAPKLVAADTKKIKGKNKRPADDETEGLDEIMAKDEAKLSKKQQKKLKNNKGEAVASEAKDSPATKNDKKVQFAKNLEQGPTGPAKDSKDSKDSKDEKAALGVTVRQGVTIDDRKLGKGRTVKAGDRVGMRYIGKLENGKVFDSNKKGAPFGFKVGKGEVIKGWDIGITGMAVGGERRLTIPAHLAYGSKGVPGIPPNSKLIFDVKLVEIK